MLIDRKLLQAAFAALALTSLSTAVSANDSEQDNYYLSQMREMSKAQTSTPEKQLPSNNGDDLLAENDLKELANQSTDLSTVGKVKPAFEKPALPTFKPKL